MNRTLLAGFAALALVGCSFAQATQPRGLSARLGAFFPSNGAARDEAPTWLAAGLDYRLGYLGQKNLANRNVSTFSSLSLDYYGKGSFSSIPVMFNLTARQDAIYASAGAGLAFQRKPDIGGTEANTRFSFQLSVGYDFIRANQPLFVEARYWGSSSAQHAGFGFYGGIRF